MCAALFGLMAVCSTISFSPAVAAGGRRAEATRRAAGSFEEKVHVAVGAGSMRDHAVDLTERTDDFLRDDARRFSQPSGQLERQRYREIAERPRRWCLDGDHRERRIVRPGSDRGAGPHRRIRRANPLMDGRIIGCHPCIRFPLAARVDRSRGLRANLGPFVIMWRVDGHEHQPVWVARRQFVRDDLLDSQVFCETGGFQQSALDPPTDSVGAAGGVDGAERLRSFMGPGHTMSTPGAGTRVSRCSSGRLRNGMSQARTSVHGRSDASSAL